MRTLRIAAIALAVVLIAIALALPMVAKRLEKRLNTVIPHDPYNISAEAARLHSSLIIGDLHTDSTLWNRDLLVRSNYGHVDIPRLQEGNIALQMFTVVTRSPQGQNYQSNSARARDNITLLALVQAWPPSTWNSLTARAVYQAERLRDLAQRAPDQLRLILNRHDLETVLEQRAQGKPLIGAVLGTEGSHALDGKLENIEKLYAAGFRMMSLQHFFDNGLGGSLHGESKAGLSPFGRQAVARMQKMGIMIDVSHSAPQVVTDVLAMSTAPLIVSHSGFFGHCQSHRNIPDQLMQQIARAGGLIGVGYWDAAVCDPSPEGIVSAIRYGIDLLGEDHVALGSDYDGSINAPFDTSEIAVLTDRMLKADFTETEIRKVMGDNMRRLLLASLPPAD